MASRWFCQCGDVRHGPLSASQLKALAQSGQLTPADEVWKEGMASRVPAYRVKGLFPEPAKESVEPVVEPEVVAAEFVSEATSPPDCPFAPAAFAAPSQWDAIYGRRLMAFEGVLLEIFETELPDAPGIYKCPHIPEAKLSSARKRYAKHLAYDDLILCVVDNDTTITGKSIDGCLCTTRRLYWKNPVDWARSIAFAELDPDRISHSIGVQTKTISLSPRDQLEIRALETDAIYSLAMFFKGLASVHKAAKATSEADYAAVYRKEREAMQRALLGEPEIADHFYCSACQAELRIEAVGLAFRCPACRLYLYAPPQTPCPKCGSHASSFTSLQRRAAIARFVGGTVGQAIGGIPGRLIGESIPLKDESLYSCGTCKHQWGLRLKGLPATLRPQ
jgi:predicted RNA-binding Zn-ribbon protein involved in translation (DUF1610 family)